MHPPSVGIAQQKNDPTPRPPYRAHILPQYRRNGPGAPSDNPALASLMGLGCCVDLLKPSAIIDDIPYMSRR